jgi:hypothetical protein
VCGGGECRVTLGEGKDWVGSAVGREQGGRGVHGSKVMLSILQRSASCSPPCCPPWTCHLTACHQQHDHQLLLLLLLPAVAAPCQS